MVCVGAVYHGDQMSNPKKICLAAIDYAEEVFQETSSTNEARKSQAGNIFWYFVKNKSFGFADDKAINLKTGDYETKGLRLCWKLNGDGGYRVADKVDLYQDGNFHKVVYILK